MPGAALNHYIKPGNYEAFFRLVLSYEENLNRQAAGIAAGCRIIDRYLEVIMGDAFKLPPVVERLRTQVCNLEIYAKDLSAGIHRTFWLDPLVGPDRYVHIENMYHRVHWAPYDGAAWDIYFGELTEKLTVFVPDLQRYADPLNVFLTLETDLKPDSGKEEAVRRLRAYKEVSIDAPIQRFIDLLDAEKMNAYYAEAMQQPARPVTTRPDTALDPDIISTQENPLAADEHNEREIGLVTGEREDSR